MITIAIKFLAGRYHATPWGRHVNEGAVEWPLSPWRILRALIATWKRTLPEITESDVRPILEKLAAAPPEFVLPPATTGHTRHYMPWFKKGPNDRTLVFDTFVVLPHREANEEKNVSQEFTCLDGCLIVYWPDASLDAKQRTTLARILGNLNTLGRAESWCEANLLADADFKKLQESSLHHRHICAPLNAGTAAIDTHEIIRLLCPDPESAFADSHVVTATSKSSGRRNKQTTEVRSSIYDPAWNICMETLQLHRERWSDPPGSRWVQYARPRDCFKPEEPLRARTVAVTRPSPQVVRFILDSTVLPLITETLPVAEAARRAIIYQLADVRGRQQYRNKWDRQKHKAGIQPVLLHGVLTGKDEHSNPLVGHTHAYFLPTDEDNDGRIDHLTIVARAGFSADEMRAMNRLRIIELHGCDNTSHPLRALMLGFGSLDEFRPLLLQSSHRWISATPYIATRVPRDHGRYKDDLQFWRRRSDEEIAEARKRGIRLRRLAFANPQGFLIANLREQLSLLLPTVDASHVTIEPLPENKIAGRWRPIQFKRFRAKLSDDGGRRFTGAFQLIFPLDVQGPIALGWSSHFGMGLFLPQAER